MKSASVFVTYVDDSAKQMKWFLFRSKNYYFIIYFIYKIFLYDFFCALRKGAFPKIKLEANAS